MIIRDLYLDGRRLSATEGQDKHTSGCINADALHFHTDSAWDGFSLVAQYTTQDGRVFEVVPEDDIAAVPAEVTEQPGHYSVTLVGVDGDQRIVSRALRLYVYDSHYSIEGAQPEDVTPTLAEQLTQRVVVATKKVVEMVDESKAATNAATYAATQAASAAGGADAAAASARDAAERAARVADECAVQAEYAYSEAVGARNAAEQANAAAGEAERVAESYKDGKVVAEALKKDPDFVAATKGERGKTGARGADGAVGPQGPAGPAGSDAQVTAANVNAELGVDVVAVLASKIEKPADAPVVGKVLKIKSVNADGSFVCEWAEDATGQQTDVRINGTSIVHDGIANIPLGQSESGKEGLCRGASFYGSVVNNGRIQTAKAEVSDIDAKSSDFKPIVPSIADYVTMKCLTDPKNHAWTTEQQAAARETIGAAQGGDFELILDVTLSEKAMLSVNKDANGNDLSLSRAYVLITSPAGTPSNTVVVYAYSHRDSTDSSYILADWECPTGNDSYNYTSQMYAEVIGGRVYQYCTFGNTGAPVTPYSRLRYSSEVLNTNTTIKHIANYAYEEYWMNAGTRVQIWGVRA